jgi:hypothetical protein
VGDVTALDPIDRFDIWHDRALFHFLLDPEQRRRYVDRSLETVGSGGWAFMATFAPDGPERCSGLPVRRYDPAGLAEECGPGWQLSDSRPHLHITPTGVEQRYAYATFRRVQQTEEGPAIDRPVDKSDQGQSGPADRVSG